MKSTIITCCSLLLFGCAMTPKDLPVVKNFDLERYLGTWYEIARLDHSFERGLSHVSADYQKRNDGGINVINRGFKRETNSWKEARGRAYPTGAPGTATLKVTFFWPFYAGYNIIELDHEDYSYALVAGPSRDYLWILSRTKSMDQATLEKLVNSARHYGFATDKLIYIGHKD